MFYKGSWQAAVSVFGLVAAQALWAQSPPTWGADSSPSLTAKSSASKNANAAANRSTNQDVATTSISSRGGKRTQRAG